MEERNQIKKAFSHVRLPERVLEETEMKIDQFEEKTIRRPKRFGKMVPIMIAVLALLAVSVSAAGIIHAVFYDEAFGTGVEGHPGGPEEQYDADGNLVKTVEQPARERVEADAEMIERLIGNQISDVGVTQTVGKYTVTVKNAVIDENNIGVFTVDIDNPNGHKTQYVEFNEDYKIYVQDLVEINGSARYSDWRVYPVTEGYSDTHVSLVYYFAPMSPENETGKVTYVFRALKEEYYDDEYGFKYGHPEEAWEEIRFDVSASEKVTATEFKKDGVSAQISPIGVKIEGVDYDTVSNMVIRFNDGAEYVLRNDSKYNLTVSCGDGKNTSYDAFNRICDVDSIESFMLSTKESNKTEIITLERDE